MGAASHPGSMDRLIQHLMRLPGIGKRSAERLAFYLLKQPVDESLALAGAIADMRNCVRQCSTCYSISESDPCPICHDPRRDPKKILVVEEPKDVLTFEQSGMYDGTYHVLMGRLAPLDGVGPGELTIEPLLRRVRKVGAVEVILGTSPTLEGDGTSLHLARALEEGGVTVTRLARGIPTGAPLEAVSKAVLGDAIHGRTALSG